MVTTTAKPAKLTPALIDEYQTEVERLEKAKQDLKPLADKVNQLYDQIDTAFRATGKDKKKVGRWLLSLITKKGSVPWKNELIKRVSSDELKAIEAAVPTKTEIDITQA